MRAPEQTAVEKLEALGVRGILLQLARDGQIVDVRCEMPQCYCGRGRRYFDPRSPRSDWSPTPDHYPRLRSHGGHLTPDNVRLAHLRCNQRDYGWRMKINVMLGKRMSPEEIATRLNTQKVPRSTARTDGRLLLFGRRSFPRPADETKARYALVYGDFRRLHRTGLIAFTIGRQSGDTRDRARGARPPSSTRGRRSW